MGIKQKNTISELRTVLKRITLIASLLFMAVGTPVFAHAHLENSTPANGDVIKQSLNKIHLSFEENLEETSTFILEDNKGTTIPFSHLSKKGKSLEGTFIKPLPSGHYKVHWKSIGDDGHPFEGDFSFSVLIPGSQKASVQPNTVTIKPTNVKVEHHREKSNYFIPGMVGFLIIIGLGSYWIIFRRKHIS